MLGSIANTSKVILTFTYDSISFVKSDLGPNVISEAIGIATTVLIIDRIIKWREIRRCHPARVFLLDEISIANNNIIKAWKDWLIALDKYGIRKELTLQ